MDDADLASRSGGRGEPAIRGEQCTVEHFGERDVRGVVGGDIAAQLVRTRHHGKCRVTRDREVTEVCDGRAKPSRREVAGEPPLAQDRDGFDVNEIGCCDVVIATKRLSGRIAIGTVVGEGVCHDRRIDGDQCR